MRKRIAQATTLALALVATPAWSQFPVGPEFQVNTYTDGSPAEPAVAAEASGGFVVAWASHDQDGSGSGVFARFFDASDEPQGGSEFGVNSYTTGWQRSLKVTLQAGKLVVVWESADQDGSGSGIFARQFDVASGVGGPEFQVNTYTTGEQQYPSVSADGAGNFIVAWQSSYAIFARRYDLSGTPQGSEFRVDTFSGGYRPAVATAPGGRFLVVWSRPVAGSLNVYGRAYDASGVPVGAEFRVNTRIRGNQGGPSVAASGNGNFVVVWMSGLGLGNYDIVGRVFNAAGRPRSREFQIASLATDGRSSLFPVVSADPSGQFVVAWTSNPYGIEDYDAFARHFDAPGVPTGPAFQLSAYTTGYQWRPSVALDAHGDFVVVWSSTRRSGVFGQRFSPRPDPIFGDGFESGTTAGWSGSATDGGDLDASALAAMNLTGVGLRGVVDDTATLYVQDDTPDDDGRYRARFYLDPNGFDPGETERRHRTEVFVAFSEAPARRVAAIVLRRVAGAYSLKARVRLDNNTHAETAFVPIADMPHAVEIDVRRASGPDARDGSIELWIDGESAGLRNGLDNSFTEVDFVRMGALGVKRGASGTLYWDEFVSRRRTYIGP